MQTSVSRFVADVRATCKETGVKLRLAPARHVRLGPGVLSNGYFSSEYLELATAVNKPEQEWLRVLVHESSHLDQWREKAPVWIRSAHAYDGLFNALVDTHPINRSYLPIWSRLARDLELDCEKRAFKKMKHWDLPIDPAKYVRAANAYVWFYTMIPELNSWYIPGREPYNDRRILAMCPEHFVEDYDNVPKELIKEYYRIVKK